ncbi:MAG TPA: tRNA (adenosine(37)-N6)-threonylcarbamoyltransferase complex ATPase subunit type 1 TsaE [Bacteroidota bacterium]|nr:tRNA (adenosine(37)-N6)-threonylcarbamoyltransferase complex ATPase subunit type 1 TsaE [Bacteroidota bacterium]
MPSYLTYSVEETLRVGREFSKRLHPGSTVALYGDLGTGKTHLIKGICGGLGVHEHVASPTFTIVNEYVHGDVKVCHIDCYRLKSEKELVDVGFEEYISRRNIVLIEWADRVQSLLPPVRFDIHLSFGTDSRTREILIEEHSFEPA